MIIKPSVSIDLATETKVPGSKLVNMLGNYLYHHLDGALSFNKKATECDVETLVLYREWGEEEIHEMTLNLNITSYSNVIRVDILETDPESHTVGFDTFPTVSQKNIPLLYASVWPKVCKRISKYYEDYEFLF